MKVRVVEELRAFGARKVVLNVKSVILRRRKELHEKVVVPTATGSRAFRYENL